MTDNTTPERRGEKTRRMDDKGTAPLEKIKQALDNPTVEAGLITLEHGVATLNNLITFYSVQASPSEWAKADALRRVLEAAVLWRWYSEHCIYIEETRFADGISFSYERRKPRVFISQEKTYHPLTGFAEAMRDLMYGYFEQTQDPELRKMLEGLDD